MFVLFQSKANKEWLLQNNMTHFFFSLKELLFPATLLVFLKHNWQKPWSFNFPVPHTTLTASVEPQRFWEVGFIYFSMQRFWYYQTEVLNTGFHYLTNMDLCLLSLPLQTTSESSFLALPGGSVLWWATRICGAPLRFKSGWTQSEFGHTHYLTPIIW